MGNIFEFDGFKPVVHETAFIHPNATVTGNVTIGRDVYVGLIISGVSCLAFFGLYSGFGREPKGTV